MMSFARRHFRGLEVASLDCAGRAFAPHFHDEFVLSINVRGAERIRPVLTHDGAAFRMADAVRFALHLDATTEEASERLIQTLDELLSRAGSRSSVIGGSVPALVRGVAERLCDEAPSPDTPDAG